MNTNHMKSDGAQTVSGLISVVIPTYNHAHFLKRALRSVIDQTYTCWEALVVDNHSNDNTDVVVASFADPRIKLFKIHNEGIIAASRNMGVRHARGEWVAFLDSDDWWLPGKLEIASNFLQRGADFVYHDMWIVRHLGRKPSRKLHTYPVKTPLFKDLLVKGRTLPNSSVVVRHELLTQIGGLDESREIIAAEDVDAWLRIGELTDRFVRLPGCLGFYWSGGGNISIGKDKSQSMRVIYEKHKQRLNESVRRGAQATIAYTAGRYQYSIGNYSAARDFMITALKSKTFKIFVRAIAMIIILSYKNSKHA